MNEAEEKQADSQLSVILNLVLGYTLTGRSMAKHELKFEGGLGMGSLATVTLVSHWKTQEYFALKRLKKKEFKTAKQREHVLWEKEVMLIMQEDPSPFVIPMHAAFQDDNHLYFVLEPAMGGDLFALLDNCKQLKLTAVRFYAGCIVLALEYFISHGILYRDGKTENFFLDSKGYLRVGDFGFAKLQQPSERSWTWVGTPDYIPPEVLHDRKGPGQSHGVNWWMLGIVVFEMLASFTPFAGGDPMATYVNIMKGKVKYPSSFTPETKSLCKGLLQAKPSARLGMPKQGGLKGLKQHQWFDGFDWAALQAGRMKPPFVPQLDGPDDLQYFEGFDEKDAVSDSEDIDDEQESDASTADWHTQF